MLASGIKGMRIRLRFGSELPGSAFMRLRLGCPVCLQRGAPPLFHFLEKSSDGISFQDLRENAEKQRAWLRSLEVIGEATKNLSSEFRLKHNEIEWQKVAGLRDKLIHHYFGVKWEIVWDVVANELPVMRHKIEEMLRDLDSMN